MKSIGEDVYTAYTSTLSVNKYLKERDSRQRENTSKYLWQEIGRCSTEEARGFLSYSVASKLCVLPLSVVGDSNGQRFITVAFPEPLDALIFKEVKFVIGLEVVVELLPREILEKAIHRAYCGAQDHLITAVKIAHDENKKSEYIAKSIVPEIDFSQESAIPRLLTSILDRGVSLAASDIHIEPVGHGYRIRYRVDGMLKEDKSLELSMRIGKSLARRIKVVCNLDSTKDFMPQDGGFTHRQKIISVRIRVSFFPQSGGEKVVLRLFDDNFLDFSRKNDTLFSFLGLSIEQENCLRSALGMDGGVILLTGPTGSGKSTLLSAMLSYLNTEWRNIVSIEDPVERIVPGVNQTEVNSERGLGFSELLPGILRQDPDVIMIGEIRDNQTAETAFTAGITGHLVLSTVHARNCIEAFPRLLHFGLSSYLIASSLRMIISQRLIPKNCMKCSRQESANEFLLKYFALSKDSKVAIPKGCNLCEQTGRKGRIGVFEMLPINDAIRDLILGDNNQISQQKIVDLIYGLGFRTYAHDVRAALLAGIIAPSSALRSLGIAPELAGY
jgi:type IV pilus assembly protein PilB